MIGLVIPVYAATVEIARTALESIAAQQSDLPDYVKPVIVRNGGLNIGQRGGPCTFVDLPVNIGFTGAVNVGLRTAQAMGADYYVVSSADVFPPRGDWIQGVIGDSLVCATEADSDAHCGHDGPCPFWGGCFGFPQALLDDVGYLPTDYSRIGDAAFAARAATRGWSVTRSPMAVEHRHPHAANNAADPVGSVLHTEKARLARQYSADLCGLLLDLNALSPFDRWERTRQYRGDR